jgi:hypothetical protein
VTLRDWHLFGTIAGGRVDWEERNRLIDILLLLTLDPVPAVNPGIAACEGNKAGSKGPQKPRQG